MLRNKVNVSGIEFEVKEKADISEHFNLLGQIIYSKDLIELDSFLCQTKKE